MKEISMASARNLRLAQAETHAKSANRALHVTHLRLQQERAPTQTLKRPNTVTRHSVHAR
eukprot:881437-Prymnesium_polylepis.1